MPENDITADRCAPEATLRKFTPGREIARDNLLDAIDDQISTGPDALIIEGNTGDGKTTLARAYANRHRETSILISVSAASKWGYDPHNVLQLICVEANRVLGKTNATMPHDFQEGDLQKLYSRLGRRGTASNLILFIIDGLHEIPDEDEHIRNGLTNLVPLGVTGIRAVFTDSVPQRIYFRERAKIKSWRIPRFTLDETREYLHGAVDNPQIVMELHRLFKGSPGSLASVYRLVSTGTAPEELLSITDGRPNSLLGEEWARLGILSEDDIKTFAALVFARTPLTASHVARLLRTSSAGIEKLVNRTTFIDVAPDSGIIRIASDAMRQYVAQQTEQYKKGVLTALIEDIKSNPSEHVPMMALPKYFQDAGRFEELIQYLTPGQLQETLRQSDSLTPLNETLREGLEAANQLRRNDDCYRFSLHMSTLLEMGKASSWDTYVDAVLALGDFGFAAQIAEGVPLIKEKVVLLASVAAAQRKEGLSPPVGLTDRIQRLIIDTSDSLSGEEAVELAGRLFVLMPDKSTQLLKKAASIGHPGGTVDWAMAQLAISAKISEAAGGDGENPKDIGAVAQNFIRDPDVRKFISVASASLQSVSAADALTQARTIENPRDRIFFLRLWTEQNRQRPDAIEITVAAIDAIVATTEYSPNASDVLRIARPLRYCGDKDAAMRCVKRLSGLLGDLTARGPTAELSRLRVLLASTTYRWDREKGRELFVEEYWAVNQIADIAIRAECFGWLVSQLSIIDPEKYLQETEGLHDEAKHCLQECVKSLLECTADHEEMLAPIIASLANAEPSVAEELISKTNTLRRRDSLRVWAIKHMLRGQISAEVLNAAVHFSRNTESKSCNDECVRAIWKELRKRPSDLKKFDALIDHIGSTPFAVHNAPDRAITAASAYATIRNTQCEGQEELLAKLKNCVSDSLDVIDDAWEAIETCLEACTILAKADATLARECLTKANTIRNESLFGHIGPTHLLVAPIRLAIAALAGLMEGRFHTANDIDRLCLLIKRLPSAYLRVRLASELAAWFAIANRTDDCRRIVDDQVLPEIRKHEVKAPELFTQCVVAAADALFLARPTTAYELFRKLDGEAKDRCIMSAAEAKMNCLPLSEPCKKNPKPRRNPTYEDINEILPLLSMTTSDWAAWDIVDRLTSAIVDSGSHVFPPQQLSEIAIQLEETAMQILPKKGWICHEGYRVLWLAAAKRITGKKLKYQDQVIQKVLTVPIPNQSDQCLVLAQLSRWAETEARGKLLKEAADIARRLPVEVERIKRLGDITEIGLEHDPGFGKQMAKETCDLSQHCDHNEKEIEMVRRRVIDAVYHVDRAVANAIVEAADTNPARITARAREALKTFKEQFRDLEVSRKVIEHGEGESLPIEELDRLPRAAWQALASLNAGRAEPKRMEDLRPFIRAASSLPLSQAYPVLAWVMANARIHFENKPQASQIMRPFFDACTMVAEFSAEAAFPERAMEFHAKDDPFLVRIGKQNDAYETLDKWIEKHVKHELIICDPYFDPADLWILKSVLRHARSARVVILTSAEKSHNQKKSTKEAFSRKWIETSDQDPPETEIIVCGFDGSGKLPIHDRWWLTDDTGLRLGTSIAGLGLRESRITPIEMEQLRADRAMIEDYTVKRIRRSPDGRRIQYTTFTLPCKIKGKANKQLATP
ncbi:MAG: AAA family ATPase [Phycisphaerae bacterium]